MAEEDSTADNADSADQIYNFFIYLRYPRYLRLRSAVFSRLGVSAVNSYQC